MSISDDSGNGSTPPKRDWKLIRAQYESGPDTLRQLAAKLGIPASTMLKRSMREHWNQTKHLVRKTAAKLESELSQFQQQVIRDELSPWIEERKAEITRRGYNLSNVGLDRMERALSSRRKLDAKSESMNARALQIYVQTARQSLGMNEGTAAVGPVNLTFLTNPGAVQIINKSA